MELPPHAPECLRCGACCFGDGERYVPVTGDDHARLGEAAEGLTHFVGNRCYMRMEAGRCAALAITSDGRFVCAVYEARPATCRELERGGPACQVELATKGERAQRALLSLFRGS